MKTEKQDSKLFYGWIVVAVSFVTLAFMGGARSSFPIFFVPLFNEFGWGRATTSIIASVNHVTIAIASPVVGALLDKYGPRKLFSVGGALIGIGFIMASQGNSLWQVSIFYGAVVGLGIAATTTAPVSVIVSQWFRKRRGLAMGIATSGVALGSAFSILDQYLIDTFDWRTAFLVLGVMMAAVIIPINSIFQRLRPEEKGLLPDGDAHDEYPMPITGNLAGSTPAVSTRMILKALLKNRKFWLLFFGSLFMGINLMAVSTHLVAFAVDSGVSAMIAASAIAIGGIIGLSGRLLAFLSDRWGREKVITVCVVLRILSLVILLQLPQYPYIWVLYAYAVLEGIFSVIAPLFFASIGDIFYGRHLGLITGLITGGLSIGRAIGPVFSGYMYDTSGSYVIAFVSSIAFVIIFCVAIWIAAPRHGTVKLIP